MDKKARLTLSSLTLSICMGLVSLPTLAALPTTVNNQSLPSLAPMLKTITPAVVSIAVEGTQKTQRQQIPETFRFFFGPDFPAEQMGEQPFRGLGSGVIIDAEKGYVVTNNHVVNGADSILIQLSDGRELTAELIGSDKMSDIALLKLEKANNLKAITLADSDKLQVGDFTEIGRASCRERV